MKNEIVRIAIDWYEGDISGQEMSDQILSLVKKEMMRKLPKDIKYEFKGAGIYGWNSLSTIFFKNGWEKALSEVKELIRSLGE